MINEETTQVAEPGELKNWVADIVAKTPREPGGKPFYYRAGDELMAFWDRTRPYAERVDEAFTVFRSVETGRLVGFVVKGVRLLLRRRDPTLLRYDDKAGHALLVLLTLVRQSVTPSTVSEDDLMRRNHVYTQVIDQVGALPLPAELVDAVR